MLFQGSLSVAIGGIDVTLCAVIGPSLTEGSTQRQSTQRALVTIVRSLALHTEGLPPSLWPCHKGCLSQHKVSRLKVSRNL